MVVRLGGGGVGGTNSWILPKFSTQQGSQSQALKPLCTTVASLKNQSAWKEGARAPARPGQENIIESLVGETRRAPSFQDLILDATVVQRLEVGELEVLFFALRGS